jgi:NADH-quinone oxidoreductase subunit N
MTAALVLAQRTQVEAPEIDWEALSPLVALTVGLCLVLLIGLLRSPFARNALVPLLTLATLGAAAGLGVWQWGENVSVVEDALRIDDLTLAMLMIFCAGGAAAVLLSWRGTAPRHAGMGEYHSLLLTAVLGMVILVAAQNLVSVFLGYELLSIPLYVLCATHLRREHSLESGLKYLIIGSAGSAILLYGMALLYGATGSTDFDGIAAAIGAEDLEGDVLFLTGVALCMTGFAF